VKDINKIQ